MPTKECIVCHGTIATQDATCSSLCARIAAKGEYGGKGKFELPPSHKAAMPVIKGGSSCSNCRFVDADKHECKNKFYIQWNGNDPKLADLPLDEICSDWWQPKKG